MNTAVLNAFVSAGAETYIGKLTDKAASSAWSGRTSFMQSLGGHISARRRWAADPAKPLRAGRRSRRRQPVRRGAGRAEHHHRRSRRHQLRHGAGPRRPPGLRAPDRNQPPADRALDRRHPRDRRRRRLDLLGRRPRPAAGGPAQRRVLPGRPATATAATGATITDRRRGPRADRRGEVRGRRGDARRRRRASGLEANAEALGQPLEAVASGYRDIAVARVATAIEKASLGRGYDPRDFTVIGYGGGSGLRRRGLPSVGSKSW